MNLACPQFVPQEVCLSCDGCCRFKEPSTLWQPKFSADEVYAARAKGFSLADKIFSTETVDEQAFIKTHEKDGCFHCHFFQSEKNTCGIYPLRPFECRLYPFVLNRDGGKISLCVHLACPHIQETLESLEYARYVEDLKAYFATDDALRWLTANAQSINDYGAYKSELIVLCDLLLPEPAAKLLNKRLGFERDALKMPAQVSSQAFSNIFLWQDYFDFKFEVIDGKSCIFACTEGSCFMYLPPLTSHLSEALIGKCFDYMDGINKKKGFARIEHVSESQLKFFSTERFAHYKKGEEYCYNKDKVIALKGRALKSKRHDLNYFLKHHPAAAFLNYHVLMKDLCLDLFKRWAKNRAAKNNDEIYLQMLNDNEQVHALALNFAEEIGLVGRVVVVDKEIKAYSFGYPLDKETFCILFEVADLSVTGLPVFIFNQFCADAALEEYKVINVMDDSGLENIKDVKMSFHPDALVPVYSVKRRE